MKFQTMTKQHGNTWIKIEQMQKIIEIGHSDFEKLINNNNYFVDKSMLIYDFFTKGAYVSLLLRPKRFGKTLNLSMIEHFFDIRKPQSAGLFNSLKISEQQAFCEEHQNKYPVINISLKDIKAANWETCFEKFAIEVADLYSRHEYILNSDKISDVKKYNFNQILRKEVSQAQLEYSLKHLSEYLHIHFNKDVIILVDEYDAPIINAFNNTNKPIKSPDKENKTYYEKVISFMQTFLGKAYKGNSFLKKGLLTGVMRVGKESIFSEWNNFTVYGVVSPYFADSFGFTEKETIQILGSFDLAERINDVKYWYNGYKLGNTENIYNPWSIVNYIAQEKAGFKPYWVNSGDYSLIKSRILEFGVQETVQELIEGKFIDKELKDNFIFQDFERNIELLWPLLIDNGYLTQVEKSKYGNYKLKIPNNEVKIVFIEIIMSWLNEEVKITKDLLIRISENLTNNNIDEFEKDFKQIIGDTLSYFDIAEKKDKHGKITTQEQMYHVYTLGLLTILSDDYIIKSNRESGQGRYHIMLIPHDKNRNGAVIEIKSIEQRKDSEDNKKFTERINNEIDKALNQIEDKKYYKELIENKVEQGNIIKLAIVFAGKEPYINKISDN